MFYAHFVLAKKGPLARIWLAAHWDKKLTKAHVFETNIESSVEGILQPKVKMALRTSGHLLLGIVRIYSRKAKYLLADCNEAFIKIKMAFRPGVVDLSEENRSAAIATITLPEVFHDFDSAVPNIMVDMDAQVSLNQSRVEDITMKEDYGALSLIADDGFEDMGFDDSEAGKDSSNIDEEFEHTSLLCESQSKQFPTVQCSISTNVLETPLKDDGFGGTVGEGLLDGETGGLFEPTGLFDDAPLGKVLENNSSTLHCKKDEKTQPEEDSRGSNGDMYEMGSMGAPSIPSSPNHCFDVAIPDSETLPGNSVTSLEFIDTEFPSTTLRTERSPTSAQSVSVLENLNSINNEGETFALTPLDTTFQQGMEKIGKSRRKRKLIVDEVKSISGEEMKSQLSDTADIVAPLDLAPPTKRLMHWKETGGFENLFSLPGQTILSRKLCDMYVKYTTTQSVDNGDFEMKEDSIDFETDNEQGHSEEIVYERRGDVSSILTKNHLESIHLDSTCNSVTSNNVVCNSSLEVPSFFQHDVFPPPQLQNPVMPNVMSPVMPHPHFIQQLLQNDQSSHLSQMIHPLIETPHRVISTNMQSSPNVCNTYSSESQNLYSNGIQPQESTPHRFENSPKTLHSLENPINLQSELPPTSGNYMPYSEFNLYSDGSHTLNKSIDNNMTLLENVALQPNTESCSVEKSDDLLLHTNQTPNYLDGQADQEEENLNQLIPLNSSIPAITSSNCDLLKISTNENDNSEDNLLKSDTDKNTECPILESEEGYCAPSSNEPVLPEEQMADETYEQFEERVLTKRTTHMLHMIEGLINSGKTVSFTELVKDMKRKQVAQKFYTLLVLKKQQAIELKQNSSFIDILIMKGLKFDDVYNSC